MIDYEILKLIWWLFIAVLLTGFAIMDGQDMGAGTLLPFLGKTNEERRIMINAVAPHWDGNEVWLLTGAGAMFAAWPIAYATAFSGFYWALLIVLFMLIFRPVAFDYRSKVDSTKWRTLWDTLLFLGSAASLSATCCRACPSGSTPRCVSTMKARSSRCSTRSLCSAALSASRW